MANTIVRYSATAGQTDFTIPFPYLEEDDVYVALNGTNILNPGAWTFVNSSTVRLATACQQGDAVIVQRRTNSDERLVDFQNGAVLTEEDLNLAFLQNFYLIQEMRDALTDAASISLVDVTAEQLEALGEQILSQQVADTLQQRVTDIDTAGELLLDAMMQRRLLGEPTDDYTAYILDTNNTMVTPSQSLAQKFEELGASFENAEALIIAEATARASADDALATSLTALIARVDTNEDDIADNVAAIATEATARATGDSANASLITALTTTVNGHTATITTLSSSVNGIEAQWGVTIDVNGHITGINLLDNGDTGVFAILADEFYIVDPANGLGSPTTVFGVSGGVVSMQNAYVAGDLLVDGTITANFEFDGGTIEIPTDGYIFSGSSTFFSSPGWWIGTESGTAKMFFGNPSGDYIKWDGTTLTIAGDVSLPGALVSNDDAGSEIVRNDTDQSGGTSAVLYTFTVFGTGTIAVRYNARTIYGGVNTPTFNAALQLKRNGVVVAGPTGVGVSLSSSYAEGVWTGITVSATTDVFTIEAVSGGETDVNPPFDVIPVAAYVDWVSVRANWQLGQFS